MQRPYVVTIHDMSSLLYPARSDVRGAMHQERYRRGAARAERIIAGSHSTRRDIESFMRIPTERIRTIYSAPDPCFALHPPDTSQDQQILQRDSIQPPFILYAVTIRPQKNVPRSVEAFAVIRSELENHHFFSKLKLVHIGDELSRYPAVRRAVVATRVEPFVRFLGFVPMETLKVFIAPRRCSPFPRSTKASASLRSKPWPAALPWSLRIFPRWWRLWAMRLNWSRPTIFSTSLADCDPCCSTVSGGRNCRRPDESGRSDSTGKTLLVPCSTSIGK